MRFFMRPSTPPRAAAKHSPAVLWTATTGDTNWPLNPTADRAGRNPAPCCLSLGTDAIAEVSR
jgi:hypothetical protein